MLEHFNHLRRQWAAKAQFLLANLRRITAANVDDVIGKQAHHIVTTTSCQQSPLQHFAKQLRSIVRSFCAVLKFLLKRQKNHGL